MHRVSIAILAGGESKRMGEDKALLPLSPSGPTLLGEVVNRVSTVTNDLFLVAPPRPGYQTTDMPRHDDRFGAIGPLGGVATALTTARHDRCIVVSCDTPFISTVYLQWLIDNPIDADVIIPTVNENGREILQPLHARYHRRCLTAFERAIAEGERRLAGAIRMLNVEIVHEETLWPLDPTMRGFFSVNTPDALATARSWYAERASRLRE